MNHFGLKYFIAAVGLATAAPAAADITVRFVEGAPKDSFTITNAGTCPLRDVTLTLDLGASAAGLIFDVTGAGAGVSVFQPLEIVAGQEYLGRVPEVKDGDNALRLPLQGLDAGASVSFTIDVDDTLGRTATMISGSEIKGAQVILETGAATVSADFDADATARAPLSACSV